MSTCARSALLAVTAFLAAGAVASAQTGGNCTHESFSVDGAPISASFCVTAASAGSATVAETFSRGDVSFTQSLDVGAVSGATVTRVVDDVPLTKFGSPKRLHLTIAYRNGGSATVEHALLLPGAVILK